MLGELVLPDGDAVWTSTIVDGLALLDVGERNARQAAARLAEDGLVVSERVGRLARWRLTASGRRLLEDGTERIYRFGAVPPSWDRRWLVVLAPVPEDERAKRHQLHRRLEFAGFGFLGPTVAVSPHVEREAAAESLLRELGLDATAIVLLAETGSFVPDEEIIRRAWDLDELGERYRAFLAEFEHRRASTPPAAFAGVLDLVHGWRGFPFDDPEIPDELMPPDWPGKAAKELFDERRAAWSPLAVEWFRALEGRGRR